VLLALADGDRHGYAIMREVEERTDGVIKLRTGTLYTLLQRLLDEELIEGAGPGGVQGAAPPNHQARGRSGAPGSPPVQKDDSRRRYYRLTKLGRDVVAAEARRLELALDEARRKQVLGRTTKA